jgi:NPCBM/NEW2 domain
MEDGMVQRKAKRNSKSRKILKRPSASSTKALPLPAASVKPEVPASGEIPAPRAMVFAVRLAILAVALFLTFWLLKIVKPLHSASATTPVTQAAVTSNEMSKPVTERRMTETFTFDGVSTLWGYSGWTRDGSANPNKDKGIYTDSTLGIDGVPYQSGIGTHAPSVIVFDLKGKVAKFSCKVGVDRGGDQRSAIIFKVYGNKKKLFESPVMRIGDKALPIDLNVHGYHELMLKVDPIEPDPGWGQADWVEIKFEK